jgi:hypothetical protein
VVRLVDCAGLECHIADRYSGSLAPPAFCRILAARFCDPARRRGPGLFLHARSRWRSERVRIPQPAGIAFRCLELYDTGERANWTQWVAGVGLTRKAIGIGAIEVE